jgi:hypothetical protein
MLLTDNGKIILGSTRAAKPKRKVSRKVSRKRRSVKRKVSRKKRSVKRKVSRKRRSVKRKASRKVSRKRRSLKRKSRKRKSAKRKASRKRKSAKRKASRKRKSAKRKSSRKKTRNSPPSGVIKQQNLGVGSVMVGQDGKTMYKVVEITMRGKPVKKWVKMKFKMGGFLSTCTKADDDAGECDSKKTKNPRSYSHQITESIKRWEKIIEKVESQIAEGKKQIEGKRKEAKRLIKEGKREEAKGLIKEKLTIQNQLKLKEKQLINFYATLIALQQKKNDRISQILGGQ